MDVTSIETGWPGEVGEGHRVKGHGKHRSQNGEDGSKWDRGHPGPFCQ